MTDTEIFEGWFENHSGLYGKTIRGFSTHNMCEFARHYHKTKAENLPISEVRLSLLNKVQEIAFGDGSAQERMVDIKALFSNEA